MIVEDMRLKVNPATLQRCGVGVDGLNIQGCAMSACVPAGIAAKVPVITGLNRAMAGITVTVEPNVHSVGRMPKSLYQT